MVKCFGDTLQAVDIVIWSVSFEGVQAILALVKSEIGQRKVNSDDGHNVDAVLHV